MKKLTAFLTCIFLLLASVAPCAAAEAGTVIYSAEETLDNGVTVVDTITVLQSNARATTKTYQRTNTYKHNGEVIAEIAITATFQYDGSTVSVVSKSVSTCETYEGWSFKQSSFTSSGGTVTLTGKLTKLILLNADVSISLTCDKNGNVS